MRWSENDDIRRSKAKQVIRGSALSPGISSQKHLVRDTRSRYVRTRNLIE